MEKVMGTVLKFPMEKIDRRCFKHPDGQMNATILLFEGVRYERKNNENGKRKKRKVLKK